MGIFDNLIKKLPEIVNEIEERVLENVKYSVITFYVISGVTPTEYRGSIYPRMGLTNSFSLLGSFKLKDHKITAIHYSKYLINNHGGKYNYLKYAIKR